MDSLFEAIGKLFGVFKDPVNVLLLLFAALEAFVIYKFVQFFFATYKESIQNDLRNTQALEGVKQALERQANAKQP
jgi:hypothetical protein